MYAGQFAVITGLLREIRDRLPEKAVAEKPTSVTSVMTDAIRLERVHNLAMAWARSSIPHLQDCGRGILVILDGEE